MNKNVKKQVRNVRTEKNVIGWQLMLKTIDVPLAVKVIRIRSLAHNSFITAITSIKNQFKQHEEPK
jgi:hypothetical protein